MAKKKRSSMLTKWQERKRKKTHFTQNKVHETISQFFFYHFPKRYKFKSAIFLYNLFPSYLPPIVYVHFFSFSFFNPIDRTSNKTDERLPLFKNHQNISRIINHRLSATKGASRSINHILKR